MRYAGECGDLVHVLKAASSSDGRRAVMAAVRICVLAEDERKIEDLIEGVQTIYLMSSFEMQEGARARRKAMASLPTSHTTLFPSL